MSIQTMSSIPRKLTYVNGISASLKDMRRETYKVNKPEEGEGLRNFLVRSIMAHRLSSQTITGAKNQKLRKLLTTTVL